MIHNKRMGRNLYQETRNSDDEHLGGLLMNKKQIEAAKEHFGKLLEKQLARVEVMKA